MGIFVNTNVTSLQGQRYLNNVNNQLNTTYQRLSSGLRINSAKDDAAGLLIADRLTTQINGLNQGNRNASDGIALMQTMEGGMDEISNMLQRIRTLAVQSANGTMTSDDRAAIQKETDALSAEINRIADQTTYGGKNILAGWNPTAGHTEDSIFSTGNATAVYYLAKSGTLAHSDAAPVTFSGKFNLQVGANNGDSLEFDVNSFRLRDLMLESKFTIATLSGAGLGSGSSNVTTSTVSIGTQNIDTKAYSAVGMGFKINYTSGSATTGAVEITSVGFSLSSQSQAQLAITAVDKILNVVDSQRADLGAAQNRLESSIRNQSNVAANSSDARSRIRDTDFASESAALSQQNIIQQAATSMLMQANMRPQLGLSLLG